MTVGAARFGERDLDFAAWLKENWERILLAAGGTAAFIKFGLDWILKRADAIAKNRVTLTTLERDGLKVAFDSMEKEIKRLSSEVVNLTSRIDGMHVNMADKDAELQIAITENRKLRAENDALHRLLAAAGIAPPLQFQALEVRSDGDLGTMGETK